MGHEGGDDVCAMDLDGVDKLVHLTGGTDEFVCHSSGAADVTHVNGTPDIWADQAVGPSIPGQDGPQLVHVASL
ncbi:unnamed protein product [Vitrella brassicaformis CCMP3155]|uniref:Uncharacterized protein n=1 Tax=Vitrella brassicaformis (strain CCMP3155) TaxID=1169540 RepID=A0A0G4EIP5_VITBC|nr:unnamed protein product [Vitrella brassicaformis CCMP3155]|eukprot:CEL96878.1 unnamed protein product [Vitrella brassicaformis CCMP3155]